MAGGSFDTMFKFSLFFLAIWTAGKTAKLCKFSAIIPEILTGLLLGPELQNWLPEAYSICSVKDQRQQCALVDWARVGSDSTLNAVQKSQYIHGTPQFSVLGKSLVQTILNEYSDECIGVAGRGWDEPRIKGESQAECFKIYCEKYFDGECSSYPDIFTLIGHLGVSLMIFESGMHFHFPMLPVVGPKASIVAIGGTIGPIIMGFILAFIFHDMSFGNAEDITAGLTAGVAMAPTSVGIALTLLMETKQLDQNFGQTIIAAAFLDDILSLIAFSLLFSFDENGVTFPAFFPLIFGTIFLLAGGYLAAMVIPTKLDKFFVWLSNTDMALKHHGKWSFVDNCHLLIMFSLLIGYALLTNVFGSHLWGCFIAGMSFSGVPGSIAIWSRQTKRLSGWMMKIFFAGTVGFSIPFSELKDPGNMGVGILIGIFACIAPKVFCAAWIGRERWVIGWAMCGRAEFAYLIAAQGRTARLIDDALYAQTLWALIFATICAPIGFVHCLKNHIAYLKEQAEIADGGQSGTLGVIGSKPMRKSGGTSDHSPKNMLASSYPGAAGGMVSLAEVFDRGEAKLGGLLHKSALMRCIRLRVLFRTAPKRSVEDIFAENECQLSRISSVRMEDGVVAIYGIRTKERIVYGDLRKIRLLAWEKLNGGPTGNNVKEINFLPPDNGTLEAGLLKFSVMSQNNGGNLLTSIALGGNSGTTRDTSLASILAETLAEKRYYILQWNYSASSATVVSEVVSYPLPLDQLIGEDTMTSTTSNATNKVAKLIHPMDNVICSEDVTIRLQEDVEDLKSNLETRLQEQELKGMVNAELLPFEASPLKPQIFQPPLPSTTRGKLIYVEILYNPKPAAKSGYSIERAMTGKLGDDDIADAAPMVVSDGYMKTGCGLTMKDAVAWSTEQLPKILSAYTEKQWHVLHMKVDHMVLIEKPMFLAVLEVKPASSEEDDIPIKTPPGPTIAEMVNLGKSLSKSIIRSKEKPPSVPAPSTAGAVPGDGAIIPGEKERTADELAVGPRSVSGPQQTIKSAEVEIHIDDHMPTTPMRSYSLGPGVPRKVNKSIQEIEKVTSSHLDLNRFVVHVRSTNALTDEHTERVLIRRPIAVPPMRSLSDMKSAFTDSTKLDIDFDDAGRRTQSK